MRFEFDEDPVEYHSQPQRTRVWTETWVSAQMYCPACGNEKLDKQANNKPAADFVCVRCAEVFELKSKNGRFGPRVVDGAYDALMSRLRADDNPNLMLLAYDRRQSLVQSVSVVPRHFFTPEIVEPRPPLGPNARRAGWVGCNIVVAAIPEHGKIGIVAGGVAAPRDQVVAAWRKTAFLREERMETRGWLIEVLRCIERIGRREFALADVYAFEGELQGETVRNSV